MATGKQDETTIVQWHPGESNGVNGLGATASLPTSKATANTAASSLEASGVRTFFDTRVNASNTSIGVTASGVRTFFDARVTNLKGKLVSSGVLEPSYTG